MKVKKGKSKIDPTVITEWADEQGKKYKELTESRDAIEGDIKIVVTNVKAQAAKFGAKDGAYVTVKGKLWEVGYQQTRTVSIDEAKAEKLLTEEQLNSIMTSSIDPKKLEKAVEEGRIDRKTAGKIVTLIDASQRIVVRPVVTNPQA